MSIKNPELVRQTKSFTIEVQDRNAKGIAIIETGVYFTPEGGAIENVQLVSLGGTKIEQAVDMELKFTAPHKVMGPSYILIKMPMPDKIEFTCNLAKTVGLKSAPTCVELGNN